MPILSRTVRARSSFPRDDLQGKYRPELHNLAGSTVCQNENERDVVERLMKRLSTYSELPLGLKKNIMAWLVEMSQAMIRGWFDKYSKSAGFYLAIAAVSESSFWASSALGMHSTQPGSIISGFSIKE